MRFLDYPNLIRLNPNVPWKTRGNAALCIRISSSLQRDSLFDICKDFVKRFADSPGANAGLVLFEGSEIPLRITDFSRRALYSILGPKEVLEIAEEFGLEVFALRSRQGLIGATAAVGNVLAYDHTYELIAYRKDLSVPRTLDKSRIIEMTVNTSPITFSSYDHKYDRVMIAPHGPDPVLCGVRGETADAVIDAFQMLAPIKNLHGWMIFRSNQGTGEHLQEKLNLNGRCVYHSGKLHGRVASAPEPSPGGHVFFVMETEAGELNCACYEPTGDFRSNALLLEVDDLIEVGGGIRKPTSLHSKVLNLEYFMPLLLAPKLEYSNPRCPSCKVCMSSLGARQGYRCNKCGLKSQDSKRASMRERKLKAGVLYIPPVKAHRHLTKPLERYSIARKKTSIPVELIPVWFD